MSTFRTLFILMAGMIVPMANFIIMGMNGPMKASPAFIVWLLTIFTLQLGAIVMAKGEV